MADGVEAPRSFWTHRVVRRVDPETDEFVYGIHETYFKDGETLPWAWSAEPQGIEAASLEDLRWQLIQALGACDKAIIDGAAEDVGYLD